MFEYSCLLNFSFTNKVKLLVKVAKFEKQIFDQNILIAGQFLKYLQMAKCSIKIKSQKLGGHICLECLTLFPNILTGRK